MIYNKVIFQKKPFLGEKCEIDHKHFIRIKKKRKMGESCLCDFKINLHETLVGGKGSQDREGKR